MLRIFCLLLCLLCASFALADEDADTVIEESKQERSASACEDNPASTEWCAFLEQTTSPRRGCNGFLRSMSSSSEKKTIVFKLLENLWHNCPKTCFQCDLHKNPRVPPALISDSEKFVSNRITDDALMGKVSQHSATVDIDRWLEVNAVLEHLFICENAEDAAQDEYFDEAINTTICEKWKDELKTTEFVAVTEKMSDGSDWVHCADVKTPNNADAIATYNLPHNLKDGMHWWCRETCQLCRRQKDIVNHLFFSF